MFDLQYKYKLYLCFDEWCKGGADADNQLVTLMRQSGRRSTFSLLQLSFRDSSHSCFKRLTFPGIKRMQSEKHRTTVCRCHNKVDVIGIQLNTFHLKYSILVHQYVVRSCHYRIQSRWTLVASGIFHGSRATRKYRRGHPRQGLCGLGGREACHCQVSVTFQCCKLFNVCKKVSRSWFL
jgi:hypothetical protein